MIIKTTFWFAAFFLLLLMGFQKGLAQTPTATANCCQIAQTVTSGSAGAFGDFGYEAVNSAGTTLYALDFTNGLIDAFQIPAMTPAGSFSGFNEPYALAMGSDGYLYVAEYGAEDVKKVNPSNGGVLATMGSWGAYQPRGICEDSNGDVYVSINGSSTAQVLVYQYTAPNSYSLAASIYSAQISAPFGLVKVGAKLYLADFNSKIFEIDQTAPPAYTFTAPSLLLTPGSPCQIAMDSQNKLYVTSSLASEFLVYNGNYSVTPSVFTLDHTCNLPQLPTGIAIDAKGYVYSALNGPAGGSPFEVIQTDPCGGAAASYQGADPPTSGQYFIYPSPARGAQATVSYDMTSSGSVEIKIWNQNAELVETVTDQKASGVQVTGVSLANFPSGVYFYSLTLNYGSGQVQKLSPRKFVVLH